jgi:hypothetical protein
MYAYRVEERSPEGVEMPLNDELVEVERGGVTV